MHSFPLNMYITSDWGFGFRLGLAQLLFQVDAKMELTVGFGPSFGSKFVKITLFKLKFQLYEIIYLGRKNPNRNMYVTSAK